MILLDTNVISEIWRPRPDPVVVRWVNRQSPQPVYLSTITLAELIRAIEGHPDPARRLKLARSLDIMRRETFERHILPFDERAAEACGKIMCARTREGRRVSFPDAAIAATARVFDLTLATRNTRDFDELGLDLVNPFEAGD
jgi:toxin FitB